MPVVFLGMTLLIMPLSLFAYDNDEGINVMKAVLMADGYPLYTQTWSDQPPIFTQLLQWVFALFGQSMMAARLLVLGLATLFIWAFTSVIRLQLGMAAAWVALLLLMLSDNFLRLSLSVMIGLPALSFAMVAIYFLQRYKCVQSSSFQRLWLIVAGGILMGIAIQTKVFVAFLVPLLALDLLDFGRDWNAQRHAIWPKLGIAILFGAVTMVTWAAIGVYYHALDVNMLLGAHLNANVRSAYDGDGGWGELSRFLFFDYGHLLLAMAGVIAMIVRRQWHGLLPLSWFVVAALLLSNHSPIWYHHYQIVAIPLCWLAAYLVPLFRDHSTDAPRDIVNEQFAVVSSGPRWLWQGTITALFILILALTYARIKATVPYYNQRIYDSEVITLLQSEADNTHWVFADQAVYPFYANLRVPPEIAVFSRKRFFGESLNNSMLMDVLQRYQPEQVLLTRFKDELLGDPEFVGYLNDHYTIVQENINYAYYQLH